MATQRKLEGNYINTTIIKDKIYDTRILFNPTLKPDYNIEIGADGITPVVPVSNVEQLMIENEELRNTLYTEQYTLSNHVSRMITYYSISSTSELKAQINRISNRNNIPPTDLYDILFDILPNDDMVTLQDYWNAGYLPLLSVYVHIMESTFDMLKLKDVQTIIKKTKIKLKIPKYHF